MSKQAKIVVACDVTQPEELGRLINATAALDEVAGFKLGALSALGMGMARAVEVVRARTSKMIIYDHQKAGNDIPDVMSRLVELVAESGIDSFIVFPFAGPEVLRVIVAACRESGIVPIVGGHMTHPSFLSDKGGFISQDSSTSIYDLAATLGVEDFVVPGNQPEIARHYAARIRENTRGARFWCPGIGRQGGSVASIADALGGSPVMAIVGSSLYQAADPGKAARELIGVRG